MLGLVEIKFMNERGVLAGGGRPVVCGAPGTVVIAHSIGARVACSATIQSTDCNVALNNINF